MMKLLRFDDQDPILIRARRRLTAPRSVIVSRKLRQCFSLTGCGIKVGRGPLAPRPQMPEQNRFLTRHPDDAHLIGDACALRAFQGAISNDSAPGRVAETPNLSGL